MFNDDAIASDSFQPAYLGLSAQSQNLSHQSLPPSGSFIENSPSLSDLDIELLKAVFNVVQFNQWFDKNTIFRLIRQNPILSSSEASVERTLMKAQRAGIIKVGLNGSGRRATRFEFTDPNAAINYDHRSNISSSTDEREDEDSHLSHDDLKEFSPDITEQDNLEDLSTQDDDISIAIRVINKKIDKIQAKITRGQLKIEDLQRTIKHLLDDHRE
jgi:hypothetical protein